MELNRTGYKITCQKTDCIIYAPDCRYWCKERKKCSLLKVEDCMHKNCDLWTARCNCRYWNQNKAECIRWKVNQPDEILIVDRKGEKVKYNAEK